MNQVGVFHYSVWLFLAFEAKFSEIRVNKWTIIGCCGAERDWENYFHLHSLPSLRQTTLIDPVSRIFADLVNASKFKACVRSRRCRVSAVKPSL